MSETYSVFLACGFRPDEIQCPLCGMRRALVSECRIARCQNPECAYYRIEIFPGEFEDCAGRNRAAPLDEW